MSKSRAKPLATTTIQINEDTWTCSVWRSKSYDRKFGDDSGAITDVTDKTIDFDEDELRNRGAEIVAHELFHAHFKYLHLDSVTEPHVDDLEEILASWIGTNLTKFQGRVNLVLEALSPKKETL